MLLQIKKCILFYVFIKKLTTTAGEFCPELLNPFWSGADDLNVKIVVNSCSM